jgi:hypothetical protein
MYRAYGNQQLGDTLKMSGDLTGTEAYGDGVDRGFGWKSDQIGFATLFLLSMKTRAEFRCADIARP